MEKYNISENEVINILSRYNSWKNKGMTDAEIQIKWKEGAKYAASFSNTKFAHQCRMDAINYQKENNIDIFYKTYGCWKKCYDYSIKNNIEYTELNRKEIWSILYSGNDYRHWILKGYNESESKKLSTKFNKPISKQSIKVLNEISKELQLEIESEVIIGNYIVDGIIENKKIIIEYFGDYWHCNPDIYGADKKINGGKMAIDIWKNDKSRMDFYIESGYNPIIIWEKDWKNNKENIIKKLKEYIND
jgi:very-short-patch-repair endonuclease